LHDQRRSITKHSSASILARWHQVDAAALQLEAIQGDALPDVQQFSATKGSNKALAPSPRTILSACQLIRI